MTTIHLLVEDDYVDKFVTDLPKEKVIVIEKDFSENIVKLKTTFDIYQNGKSEFISYYESMKNISIWLKGKES